MLDVQDRHPAVREFADMFEYAHLPVTTQAVSKTFHDHAADLLLLLPDGPGLTRALHRLWESKNEAVFLAVRVARGDT